MSAAAGYKPVHGGYPGVVPGAKPTVYVVSHADGDGNPLSFNRNEKYDVAWIGADRYGGNGNGASEERGHFSCRERAERYCEYRRQHGGFFGVFSL